MLCFWRGACDTGVEGNTQEGGYLAHNHYGFLRRGVLGFWRNACHTVVKGNKQEGG